MARTPVAVPKVLSKAAAVGAVSATVCFAAGGMLAFADERLTGRWDHLEIRLVLAAAVAVWVARSRKSLGGEDVGYGYGALFAGALLLSMGTGSIAIAVAMTAIGAVLLEVAVVGGWLDA